MGSKRRAWRISRRWRDIRAGPFTPTSKARKTFSLPCSSAGLTGRIEEVSSLLRLHGTPEKRLRALREHYAQLAKDRRLALLSLEFKLFAIRHPEAHARLRPRQQKLRACGGNILIRVMEELGRALPISSTAAATGLGALSNALLLEHLVDPKTLPDSETRHLLGIFFDAVIRGEAPKS